MGTACDDRMSVTLRPPKKKKKKYFAIHDVEPQYFFFFFFFNQQLKTPNKTKQKMQTGSTLTIFSHPNVSISAKVFLYCYTRK